MIRKFCSSLNKTAYRPKICIVGSGPAGFYAAQHIRKHLQEAEIDIYERLPVPFGLVRFGVAPDHADVKNVINSFTRTAESPNVRFIGNVELGRTISLKQLRRAYHAVLLTYGAEENRELGVPGEGLRNVIPARRFVGWYNGAPEDTGLGVDLSGESVVIFGQGNVAIDVARILLSPLHLLQSTDITEYAFEVLAISKVKQVYLVGRRGPLQAACTIKELREILKLEGCATCLKPKDFDGIPDLVPNLERPRKRITELMLRYLNEPPTDTALKKFNPLFFRSPLQIAQNQITLRVNTLNKTGQAVPTDQTETLACDLSITSIGYKSVQADPDIPFDEFKGIAKNVNGKIDVGLYAAGWLATGPRGVIINTMNNAFGVADTICTDLKMGCMESKPGYEKISEELRRKNVQSVLWQDWLKIDEYEKERGRKVGKTREKVVDVGEMLRIAS